VENSFITSKKLYEEYQKDVRDRAEPEVIELCKEPLPYIGSIKLTKSEYDRILEECHEEPSDYVGKLAIRNGQELMMVADKRVESNTYDVNFTVDSKHRFSIYVLIKGTSHLAGVEYQFKWLRMTAVIDDITTDGSGFYAKIRDVQTCDPLGLVPTEAHGWRNYEVSAGLRRFYRNTIPRVSLDYLKHICLEHSKSEHLDTMKSEPEDETVDLRQLPLNIRPAMQYHEFLDFVSPEGVRTRVHLPGLFRGDANHAFMSPLSLWPITEDERRSSYGSSSDWRALPTEVDTSPLVNGVAVYSTGRYFDWDICHILAQPPLGLRVVLIPRTVQAASETIAQHGGSILLHECLFDPSTAIKVTEQECPPWIKKLA